MARLFDSNGASNATVTYDATTAKFTTAGVNFASPFNFGTTAAFLQKADMSAVSNATDCGECHVGGGGMEYIPNTYDVNARIPLRTANAGVLAGKVTSFNYFVDSYDADGDGIRYEALENDYTKTGVVEMDCLMCHLNGYDYEAGKAAKRVNKFDASRVLGADLGTAQAIAFGAEGYGRSVTYDAAKLVAVADVDPVTAGNQPGYVLDPSVASQIKPTPPSDNCVNCHFAIHQVDWKKRGDKWDPTVEVHFGLGCMACHERTNTDYGTTGYFRQENATEPQHPAGEVQAKLGLCDPAKGNASPFDQLSDTIDMQGWKSCAGCHYRTVTDHYNAPDPTAAHAAKGLSDVLVQKKIGTMTGPTGTANASHIDLIACETCHVKKDASITGGAFVDGSGPDEEGRLATHDHAGVERNMDEGIGLWWSQKDNKLHPGNFLTSFFWRSKNDLYWDGNADGRKPGVDGMLQTHIGQAVNFDHSQALFADGYVDSVEIAAHISNLNTVIPTLAGAPAATPAGTTNTDIKLSFVTVPFKIAHNIGQANTAWGTNGCTDCHGANKGFYNGSYNMNAKASINWTASTQLTPFTKVNASTEAVDSHPGQMDKYAARSVGYALRNATGLRNPDRAEFIYEGTFQKRDTTWRDSANPIVSSTLTFANPGAIDGHRALNMAGAILKLEVDTDGVGTTIEQTRTRQVPGQVASGNANPLNCGALMTKLGQSATVGSDFTDDFEFVITCTETRAYSDNSTPTNYADDITAQGYLTITAKPGNRIRINPVSDAGDLGLGGAVYTANPWIGTDGISYAGRTAWEAHLNAQGQPPVADIATINGINAIGDTITVSKGASVAFVAANGGNMSPTYSWNFGDGSSTDPDNPPTDVSSTHTYTNAGSYLVVLTVRDSLGRFAKAINAVKVIDGTVPPETGTGSATWTTADVAGTTNKIEGSMQITVDGLTDLPGNPGFTKLYIIWGDLTANQTYNRVKLADGTYPPIPQTFTISHGFKPLLARLVDTDADGVADPGEVYRYTVKVRIYDGSAKVGTIYQIVDVPVPTP